MSFYLKDPGSRVDYAIEWGGAYLGERVLAGSGWSVAPAEPGGVAVEGSSFSLTRTAVTLENGQAGHVYSVTNRVTLSDGQVDERSITIRVDER